MIDVAGSFATEATRVNDLGQIVGTFETHNIDQLQLLSTGFLRQPDGTISLVEFPGARTTVARGINDNGWIVGEYTDSLGYRHAFLRDANGYRTLTTPEPGCDAIDINNAGTVIGHCLFLGAGRRDYAYVKHGVDDAAKIDILIFGSFFTEAQGINNKDQIVGLMGVPIQGFLASPIAPPTVTVTSHATSFQPTDVLSLDVTVANPGDPVAVEVYFGVVLPSAAGPGLGCPGGDAVAFITPGSAQVTCLSAPPQSFQAFANDVTIPGALPSTTLSDFFKYTGGRKNRPGPTRSSWR